MESSDLPAGLGKPATRALAGAGIQRLDELSRMSEAEVLKLHGMGPPRALDQIRRALAARANRSPAALDVLIQERQRRRGG